MPQAFYILFGALFTVYTSYALGKLLLQRFPVQVYREEERIFAFVCGASILHLIVFVFCALHIARKSNFLIAGLVIIVWAWARGAMSRQSMMVFDPLPRSWRFVFGITFAAYAFVYAAHAMAPEMSPDGSSYHLGLVARYLRERGFPWITTNMYANLTQGVEMLYLFAFSFGRHSSASLVHCAFTLALPIAMLNFGRRWGFPKAGVGGAILVMCAPVIGVDGTTAYVDVAVACIVFTLFSLLQIWREERQSALLILAGLVAGYCFASKYTAAVAIPYAGLFVLWKVRGIRQLLPMVAAAALMVVPWMAKNWIVVGNPLSPFANRFFPNANVTISFEQEYIMMMRDWGQLKSPWEIPGQLTIYGDALGGIFGPVFVLTPLALLALRRREGRHLLLAALVFAAGYYNNRGTRFLIPAFPLIAMSFAIAIERSRGVLPALMVLHAVISWPHVLWKYVSPNTWRIERIPVAAALRITPEEKYLSRSFGPYLVARMIEDFVPPGARILSFSGTAEAYMTRELLVAYQSATGQFLSEMIWTAVYPESAPKARFRFRFPQQTLRRVRLVQNATGTDQWSISELRVKLGEQELTRLPEWRIKANPNPWLAPYAIDNDPVSRWRTAEPIRPGMFVELDFGTERRLDEVLLEATDEQGQVNMKLVGQNDAGGWRELAGAPEFSRVPPMKGLRRAAVEQLRAHGIGYILAASDDPAAEDYRVNGKLWGVHPVAERGNVRLYAIEGAP